MDVRPRARSRCAVLQMLLGSTTSTLYQRLPRLLCFFRALSKVQRSEASVASFGCDFRPVGVGRRPARRLRALGKLWRRRGCKIYDTSSGETRGNFLPLGPLGRNPCIFKNMKFRGDQRRVLPPSITLSLGGIGQNVKRGK